MDVGVGMEAEIKPALLAAQAQDGDDGDLLMMHAALQQQRCLPPRRPTAAHQRGHQKAAFIEKHAARHSRGGLFFNGTPGMAHPVANGFFIPLDGAALGFLGTPTQGMQKATHMIGVIVHLEATSNPLRHARTGPQLGFKTGGLCAAKQIFFQSAAVRGDSIASGVRELGERPRRELPRPRTDAFQRRTLRRSTPTRRATSTGLKPSRSNANPRNRRRSNSCGTPGRSHRFLPGIQHRTLLMQESIKAYRMRLRSFAWCFVCTDQTATGGSLERVKSLLSLERLKARA